MPSYDSFMCPNCETHFRVIWPDPLPSCHDPCSKIKMKCPDCGEVTELCQRPHFATPSKTGEIDFDYGFHFDYFKTKRRRFNLCVLLLSHQRRDILFDFEPRISLVPLRYRTDYFLFIFDHFIHVI